MQRVQEFFGVHILHSELEKKKRSALQPVGVYIPPNCRFSRAGLRRFPNVPE